MMISKFYSTLVFVLLANFSGFAQLVINEVQTANMSTLADQDGQFKDWFELYNSGTDAVDLAGYGLSDDANLPLKWALPAMSIDAGEHLLIWASGKDLGGGTEHYETAIFSNDLWKYIVPTSEPSSAWRFAGYNDELWNSGAGGFGYGDGDDGTDVGTATAVYMRKTFSMDNPETVTQVILHMDFDDAFVAYLNGVEIARVNLGTPGTPPAFADLATGDHEALGYQGQVIEDFVIDQSVWNSLLVEDENVLAIQVHNSNPGSSDLTGNAFLTFAFAGFDMQYSPAPAWMGYGASSNELHTNFSLATGEILSVADADGNILDQITIPPTALENSYCRESSGSTNWCYATVPTPNEENANTVCAAGYEPIPVFNIESGVFSSTQFISLSSTSPTAEIHYTTTGGIPTLSDPIYTSPIELDTTATISAKGFSTGSLLPSPVEKNTYMIDEWGLELPIISISTDWANLYDYDTGIYAYGPPDYGGYPYFGANFWEDWEREAYVEYFDADHVKQIEGPVGIKIHGGWSRAQPQKSFRLECRGDYGMERLNYPLIPDKPFIESFNGINLRNGGNDYWSYRFHDAFMQRVFSSTHADYMGYSPTIVFLNGEYWGFMEIRENQDENWIEDNHGINSNDVTVISSNYLGWNVISGSDDSFDQMHSAITSSDPLADDFYSMIDGYIDLENLVDYVIAETYYGNGDWGFGWNNTKFWHDDTPGGKWHFALMDLDFGMGCAPMDDYIYQATNGGTLTGQIFTQCLQNPTFRDYFIIRYADLMNTIFQPGKMEDMIYEMRDELVDAFPRHCQLWGTDCGSIDWAIDVRLDWNENRFPGMRDVLQEHFGLSNKVDITLDVIPTGAGRIHISTVEPEEEDYPWTGVYYNGFPIQITAIANPGYVFDHWDANGIFPVEVNTKQFVMNFEDDETFTANFTGAPIADAVEITEFMYHDDDLTQSGDWVEVHNKLSIPVDLSSMYLKDQSYFNRFDIPLNTVVPAGGYLVLAEDTAQFIAQNPEVENAIGPWSFELNNDEDDIRIFSYDGESTTLIHYTDAGSWPALTDGTGRSVEYNTTMNEQNNGLNWFAGCIGGSPGQQYDPLCGGISVEEITGLLNWNIYPNPTDAIANINLSPEYIGGRIAIRDITGKLVSEISLNGSTSVQMDASGLANGIYTIQLFGDFGNDVKKLVVR